MPTLRITSRVQAFDDIIPGSVSEPLKRFVDWERFASGMPAREVSSDRRLVPAGGSLTLANVTTVTGIAAGALYDLKAHPTEQNRYQIRYKSGAISNPLAGLASTLAVAGHTYVIATNDDGSITLTDTSIAPSNFGLARGATVYLAGSDFGDTGPFVSQNQGFWVVEACSAVGTNPGAQLILKRADATDSPGLAESVTGAAVTDIQAPLPISAAFVSGANAPAYVNVWAVTEAASGWFSIDSLVKLPDLLNIGLTALTLAEGEFLGYYRVEVDGPAQLVVTSGDLTAGTLMLRPVKFSDPLAVPVGGWSESYGFFTSLVVQNVGDTPVNANIVLAYLES